MKPNIFIIDRVTSEIVDRLYSDNPKEDAEKEAVRFFEKGEGKPVHKFIPTDKHPTRYGIETPTDFFIHYIL